jgi:hypothetical protein
MGMADVGRKMAADNRTDSNRSEGRNPSRIDRSRGESRVAKTGQRTAEDNIRSSHRKPTPVDVPAQPTARIRRPPTARVVSAFLILYAIARQESRVSSRCTQCRTSHAEAGLAVQIRAIPYNRAMRQRADTAAEITRPCVRAVFGISKRSATGPLILWLFALAWFDSVLCRRSRLGIHRHIGIYIRWRDH